MKDGNTRDRPAGQGSGRGGNNKEKKRGPGEEMLRNFPGLLRVPLGYLWEESHRPTPHHRPRGAPQGHRPHRDPREQGDCRAGGAPQGHCPPRDAPGPGEAAAGGGNGILVDFNTPRGKRMLAKGKVELPYLLLVPAGQVSLPGPGCPPAPWGHRVESRGRPFVLFRGAAAVFALESLLARARPPRGAGSGGDPSSPAPPAAGAVVFLSADYMQSRSPGGAGPGGKADPGEAGPGGEADPGEARPGGKADPGEARPGNGDTRWRAAPGRGTGVSGGPGDGYTGPLTPGLLVQEGTWHLAPGLWCLHLAPGIYALAAGTCLEGALNYTREAFSLPLGIHKGGSRPGEMP